MLATQKAAPNSPQWFNTGLHWAYGIDGPSQGHYYVDYKTGQLTASETAYEHPQPHACFIQSASATTSSTRAASWTSGCARRGCSSTARAPAPTSPRCAARASGSRAAASSSGLMSFLKIGDRAAGAIKSGGTTRRAAKMVVVDVDHPGHRGLCRLEGEGGAEGRRAGHRLQDHLHPPQGDHEGLRQLRGRRRRLLRPVAKNPALKREVQGRQAGAGLGELHQAA
jgi:ribonucleoside-diphosphate reductase alpha chain